MNPCAYKMGEEFNQSAPDSQKISQFNSAISILMRLDNLWKDTHTHMRQGDMVKWNWDLDRVWCELAADADEADFATFDKYVAEIALQKDNKSLLYHVILRKEIWLRKLENKQGKGTSYKDSVSDYMD